LDQRELFELQNILIFSYLFFKVGCTRAAQSKNCCTSNHQNHFTRALTKKPRVSNFVFLVVKNNPGISFTSVAVYNAVVDTKVKKMLITNWKKCCNWEQIFGENKIEECGLLQVSAYACGESAITLAIS
jgi:hypothetical protein